MANLSEMVIRWPFCMAAAAVIVLGSSGKVVNLPALVVPRPDCPNGFKELAFSGDCFGVFPVPPNTGNALTVCPRGSTMADVLNSAENNFTKKLFNELDVEADQRAWLRGGVESGSLIWDSGCYPAYNGITDFYSNPPTKMCLAMDKTGVWHMVSCGFRNEFVVCAVRTAECSKTKPETPNICPDEFPEECSDDCLTFHHPDIISPIHSQELSDETHATLSTAKAACRDVDAHLMTVRDSSENECISRLLKKYPDTYWLGLYKESNLWRWDNPEVAQGNAQFWESGEPKETTDQTHSNKLCTAISGNAKWRSVPCDSTEKHGYICAKKKVSKYYTSSLTSLATIPTTSVKETSLETHYEHLLPARKMSTDGWRTPGAIAGFTLAVAACLLILIGLLVYFRRKSSLQIKPKNLRNDSDFR